MEFILKTELGIPLFHIILLLSLSTIVLLLGKLRLALLINYVFTLYWGYVFNRDFLIASAAEVKSYFTWMYFGFGFAVIVLALIGFVAHRE